MLRLFVPMLASIATQTIHAQRVIDPIPGWSLDIQGATGSPVEVRANSVTSGLLVSKSEGAIVLVGPDGKITQTMRMDLPCDSPSAVADLRGDGKLEVVCSDCQASVYAFDLNTGSRLWKYTQTGKNRDYRVPVTADLDGDGKREVIIADSRGSIRVLTPNGKLRMQVDSSKYRAASPAVGDIGAGRRGLISGTDAGEIDCLDRTGSLIWSQRLSGGYGRALPVLVGGADPIALIPRVFPNSNPALLALRARDGKLLWTASAASQVYHSIAVTSLAPGEGQSILFGDKHTRLYCVDLAGKLRWKTQLDGRGIYVVPAIADLNGDGRATIFEVVRGEGDNGKVLYALDHAGQVLDSIPLPGGGGAAPLLCRFAPAGQLQLITLAGKKLSSYNIAQRPGAKPLWSGLRNDSACSGEIDGARPVKQPPLALSAQRSSTEAASKPNFKTDDVAVVNTLLATVPPSGSFGLRMASPDGTVHVRIVRPGDPRDLTDLLHNALVAPGNYMVDIRAADRDGVIQPLSVVRVAYLGRELLCGRALAELGRQVPFVSAQRPEFETALNTQLIGATLDLHDARGRTEAALFDSCQDRSEHAAALVAICRELLSSPSLLVRQLSNPWKNHIQLDLLKQVETGPVRIEMPGNSFLSAAVSVTNLASATINLHAESSEVGVPQSAIAIRDCVRIVPSATGNVVEDPLPSLTGGSTVRLQPGESHKLWLTFCSRGMVPGTYQLNLRCGDPGSIAAPTDTPITLVVLPVALPQHQVYRHINWLYLASIPDPLMREKTLRDALDHGTTIFNVPSCSVNLNRSGEIVGSETTLHDSIMASIKGKAEAAINGTVGLNWPAGFSPSPELSSTTLARAIRWYAEHMRSIGFTYSEYALYITDEPGIVGADTSYLAFVDQVHAVKAADPQMRIFCNPAGGASAQVLAPIADDVDIWCPDMHLVKTQPVELQTLFKHKGEYLHYEAPADQRSLDPLGFYRMQAWVAFQYGMIGGGYWVYSGASDWYPDPNRNGEYGATYPTPDGPVPSKRWEGTREGIQDFELIRMLRDKAHAKGGSAGDRALKLIDEAVAFVTKNQDYANDITRQAAPFAPDYQIWMLYREKIIRELMAK